MRNISANGLAKLAQQYGTEPVNICEIDWVSTMSISGAPVINAVVTTQTLISWHVSEGTTTTALIVDGKTITPIYGPDSDPPGANYSGVFGTLPAGTYEYTIKAEDGQGRTSQYNGTFTISGDPVDPDGPEITDVVITDTVITWHVEATNTWLLIDGKGITVNGPDENDNYYGELGDLLVGTHYFVITAKDGDEKTSHYNGIFTIPGPTTSVYADKEIGIIPGKILEVSDLDNIINVGDSSNSQEITITLDDSDGSIKSIMDQYDIHKRPARVYQYFTELALTDKFLIFSGEINTPIIWNERDRTVTITVVSQLEDKEIGFSAEEGQFPYLPADLVGRAWPMVFGKVLNYPVLQINQAVKGTTLTGVGIVSGVTPWQQESSKSDDSAFWDQMAVLGAQASHLLDCSMAWDDVDNEKSDDYQDKVDDIYEKRREATSDFLRQKACERANQEQNVSTAVSKGSGDNPIRILGGEDFPQNTTLGVSIGGGTFTGRFNGEYFTVSGRNHAENEIEAADAVSARTIPCTVPPKIVKHVFEDAVPPGCFPWDMDGDGILKTTVFSGGGGIANVSNDTTPVAKSMWADSGGSVSLTSYEAITYIASIVPGTVLAVKAYKQLTGERRLTHVPSNLYTVNTQRYGSIIAVQIILSKPLSSLDEGWSDDIYVTFESSVGPNIVDIFKYIIQNYTSLTWDSVSFSYVRAKLQKFPANFPILDRKNTIQVLQEIAFQARCAIWINNGVFYLKYLPEEPTPVDTITVSDIDAEGVQVELTSTEEIVTKMKVTWRMSWTPESDRPKDDNEKMIILRHNITKYGTQEEEYDFYIYNQPDIVYKCATFWLIRKSKTWKKIRFKTFLDKLNLETFDAVTLDLNYVSTGSILSLVEKANYNSTENSIDFECLVPVIAGEMTKYKFFWPAALLQADIWPTMEERADGSAGGGGIGSGAYGNLPIGDTSTIEDTIFIGGQNVVFGAQSDFGDSSPTDVGFTAQTVVTPASYSGLTSGRRPVMNLRVLVAAKAPIPDVLPPSSATVIDIRKTRIIDSEHKEIGSAYLSSIIAKIYDDEDEGNILVLDADKAKLCSTEQAEPKVFDFKYDEEGEKFGAGTAFLQEEEEEV